MVGWSRRNRESAKRRAAWWATLSEEEKEAALIGEREVEGKAVLIFYTCLTILGLVVLLMVWSTKDKKPVDHSEPHRRGGFTDTGKGPVVFPTRARPTPDAR